MLKKKDIEEIRNHLDKAQNPLFLFDNDPDGLCSFLLLQRYCEKGKGFPIKSFPELDKSYFRKVSELEADYIFILDKPVVSREFFEEVKRVNIPVVWIDHHRIEGLSVPEFVYYYNSADSSESDFGEPVTDICYSVSAKKEDMWLAVVGCVSDHYVPSYYSDFIRDYPDLAIDSEDAFDIFYKSEIGKIARIISFALKDRITNVIGMIKFLMKVKNPYDVLEDNSKNHSMHSRFKQIDTKYNKLLDKALSQVEEAEKVLFFKYGGDMSMSADLANELIYLFPDRIVVVVFITGIKANISVRGKGVKDKVLNAISGLEDATGGGHEDAVGAKVKIDDLETFRKRLLNEAGF